MTENERYGVIETIPDLECLAAHLASRPRIAVDLESDSFYAYHHKTCLIQLSDDEADYIVDPLAVRDLSPLGPLLRNPAIEKVFHAAEYDIQCLKRDYSFEVFGLFDTMAAERLLGGKQLGLAALILKYFGISLSKKLQRADWGKRPLSPDQIEYARCDTHYLLRLRDILRKDLQSKDRLVDAQEEFKRLERLEPSEKTFDPDGWWRLPGARSLEARSRAALKELYFFREKTAAELDKAPFRVFPEPLMVRIAQRLPKDPCEIEKLSGMTAYLFKRFGRELLELVEKGSRAAPIQSPPGRPPGERWDGATMLRYQRLREWRKKKADERSVDPVVVLPTDDLRELAKAPAAAGEPPGWIFILSERKRALYGEELLAILSAPPPAPGKDRRRRRRRR